MPAAYLFDLDGTLYTDAGPIPGAADLLRELKRRGVPYRCVTNTTSRPRREIVGRLRANGFDIDESEIQSPARVAVALAQERGYTTVAPFVPEATLVDLEGLDLVGGTSGRPSAPMPVHRSAVLLADLGERWSYALMQEAFGLLMAGAELIALSRDRYYQRHDGLALDAGPFVAALEYATDKSAIVAGKPSAEFFHMAARSLALPEGASRHDIAMVGDDLFSDVQGAQRAGYQGWLVRTGKFREENLKRSGVTPDRVLGSVAEVVVGRLDG